MRIKNPDAKHGAHSKDLEASAQKKMDDALFYPQHKLDVSVLKKNLPSEAMYITSFANNIASFDNWSVWDSINETPSKVSVQSFDDFYTFDSISIKPRLV